MKKARKARKPKALTTVDRTKHRAKILVKFYGKLPRPIGQMLHDRAKRIRLIGLQGTKAILAAGRYLTEVRSGVYHLKIKSKLQSDTFVNWLKLEGIGISVATAYNWIRFYEYAQEYGVGIVNRLGIKMLTGATHKVVARQLIAAGELTPKKEKELADKIKTEVKTTKTVSRERKKLLTKSLKAVFEECRRMIHTSVTNRVTNADKQVRAVVSLCNDLLKDAGAHKEFVVVNRKDIPSE